MTDLTAHPIARGHIEYARSRTQSRLHQLILREFIKQEDLGLTQAELARRLGKGTDVISRLLGSPGNWTVNTASDLLLGMGAELALSADYLFPTYVVPTGTVETTQPSVFGRDQDIPPDTNLNILVLSGDPLQPYPLSAFQPGGAGQPANFTVPPLPRGYTTEQG